MRTDATFLSGHTALSVQAMVAASATTVGSSHGILAQGPMDGNDGSAGLILQYLPTASNGAPNVVHFKVTCSDGAAFVVSAGGVHRPTPQLLHGVWRQGEPARLFIDGVESNPAVVSTERSGLTAMPAGGLFLGAGARDPRPAAGAA
jgi:hypothetical protein